MLAYQTTCYNSTQATMTHVKITWNSCECISREIHVNVFHVKFLWKMRETFIWNTRETHSREFYMNKFTWNSINAKLSWSSCDNKCEIHVELIWREAQLAVYGFLWMESERKLTISRWKTFDSLWSCIRWKVLSR